LKTPTATERSRVIPEEHYVAVRDAVRVFFENAARQEEIQAPNLGLGINAEHNQCLLNNSGALFRARTLPDAGPSGCVAHRCNAEMLKLGDTAVT
jgi:hypothetical protein